MAKKLVIHDRGKRLSATQFEQLVGLLCPLAPGRLPLEYERFLRKYNGGRPEPAHFRWRDEHGERESEVYSFLGISPDLFDSGIVRVILNLRAFLPGNAIPIALLDYDILLLFVAGQRVGQIWLLSQSGVELEDGPEINPERVITFVRKSFPAFIKSLYHPRIPDPYSPVTIALDSPRVRGKRLEAILKSLGCKKWKYPGVLYSATPLPPAWHWPKFQTTSDVGGPAFLSVEKNRTYGYAPKFDERAPAHKMLRVNVTKSERSKCVRELMIALGDGAVLLDGE
jgi:hypothetical protein